MEIPPEETLGMQDPRITVIVRLGDPACQLTSACIIRGSGQQVNARTIKSLAIDYSANIRSTVTWGAKDKNKH